LFIILFCQKIQRNSEKTYPNESGDRIMTDKVVVLSTCGSTEEAGRVARALVEKRLAACVNVLPGVRSLYRWKDAIEDEEEVLLVIKTSRALVDELRVEIERLHSYEVPEVIALAVVDGSERYLAWVGRELAHKPSL
jgi:periplasmic divalent cation tolerance protein